METETKHPAHRRIERANAQDQQTHAVQRTATGRFCVSVHYGSILADRGELQAIVNAAADLGVHAQLWTDGGQ